MDINGKVSSSNSSIIEDLKSAILKVLINDPKTMPMNVLMHKVFKEVKSSGENIFIKQEDFLAAVDQLLKSYLIGKNKYNKYFIDYLDYPKSDVFGEGFLEIDHVSGNGYITVKKRVTEYKKSSHFVHKKNLNGAKHGDYVRYVELLVKNPKHFNKFVLTDASIESILEKPKVEVE